VRSLAGSGWHWTESPDSQLSYAHSGFRPTIDASSMLASLGANNRHEHRSGIAFGFLLVVKPLPARDATVDVQSHRRQNSAFPQQSRPLLRRVVV
jgi:hypothetical protein